jgi:hypothetical protein
VKISGAITHRDATGLRASDLPKRVEIPPSACLENDLELNRSAHHWDEGSRSLPPEDRVCAAVEVVE